jgi:hypothetical protein
VLDPHIHYHQAKIKKKKRTLTLRIDVYANIYMLVTMPITRFNTALPGTEGDMHIITSPICNSLKCCVMCSTPTSPDMLKLGNMEGPMHFLFFLKNILLSHSCTFIIILPMSLLLHIDETHEENSPAELQTLCLVIREGRIV